MFNGFFICGTIKESHFAITPLRKMECLHGEPASSSETTNGIFFYRGQWPSCNFFCPQNDYSYFVTSTTSWLKCES